jgi:hypothetical protein
MTHCAAVLKTTRFCLSRFAEQFPFDCGLFDDDVHMNSKGTRVKAQLFAEAIIKSGLLATRQQHSHMTRSLAIRERANQLAQ